MVVSFKHLRCKGIYVCLYVLDALPTSFRLGDKYVKDKTMLKIRRKDKQIITYMVLELPKLYLIVMGITKLSLKF